MNPNNLGSSFHYRMQGDMLYIPFLSLFHLVTYAWFKNDEKVHVLYFDTWEDETNVPSQMVIFIMAVAEWSVHMCS